MSKLMTTSIKLFKPSAEPYKPRKHDEKSIKFLLEHACAALLLSPGMGKTAATLAAIKILKQKKQLKGRVLIIAPLRVCYSVWPDEVEKWEDFHGLTIDVLHGKDKDKILAETKADILVINFEGLEWLLQAEKIRSPKTGKIRMVVNADRFKKLNITHLVIDELSKVKNHSSQRSKMLRQVVPMFQRRWGLTGSPAANGLMGLFGQALVLDEGRSLGRYITHYRSEYFVPVDPSGFVWQLQKGAEKLIYQRVAPLMLRMETTGNVKLPVMMPPQNIKVKLSKSARKIYDQIQDDLISKVRNKVIVATNSAAAAMMCRQIANGGIYRTPETEELINFPRGTRDVMHIHDAKTDALAELIDELEGQQLLVAYDFKHDLGRLKAKFGEDLPYIGGGVTAKRGKELQEAWNAGEIQVLYGHPQSIGHGVNLQESHAHHVCFYSMTYDFELYDQFIKRLYRSGNKAANFFVHHILAEDTVDYVMLYALRSKDRTQQSFFKGLIELANE